MRRVCSPVRHFRVLRSLWGADAFTLLPFDEDLNQTRSAAISRYWKLPLR